MKYLLGIIFLVLCFSTSGAYQLSQDFVGVGSVDSARITLLKFSDRISELTDPTPTKSCESW